MKTIGAFFTALTITAAFVGPAHGNIDVAPDPGRPRVILDGSEINRPRPIHRHLPVPVGSAPAPSPPIDNRNTFCELDDAGIQQCYFLGAPPDPEQEPEEERELTPGDVLRATREIGLPSLKVQIQPGEKTLVNVETIFYAQPQTFARSVSLLGFDVDVEAEPVSYEWIHGDGTTAVTDTPGKPYPAKDVTHRYRAPADDVQPRVDVTYRVKYRVDGGPWQTIGQTLLASGPAAELDVKEAAPVMTTPRV